MKTFFLKYWVSIKERKLFLKRQTAGVFMGLGLFLIQGSAAIGFDLSLSNRRLMVRFNDQVSLLEASTILERISQLTQISFSERKYLPLLRIHILEVENGLDLNLLAEEVKKEPSVVKVEIDSVAQGHAVPNDPFFNSQWALNGPADYLQAEKAWDRIQSAESILITVIDSGCNADHPDLANNVWNNPGEIPNNQIDDDGDGYIDNVIGYDFIERNGSPNDDNGHGTMVSGVIGAQGDNQTGVTGIVWKANIMCLKFMNGRGEGFLSDAVEAIEFAIAKGAKIINASWGYVSSGPASSFLEDAILKARDSGILFIASAGNNSMENNPERGTATYPSSYSAENIISVAATDSFDELTSFSNYGFKAVDLGSPGLNIYTTSSNLDFCYFSGTSASTPYVTGAAALIWALNPTLDYAAVKQILLNHTDPLPSLQGKTLTGGRLNVASAVFASPNGAIPPVSSPPSGSPPSENPASASPASGGCQIQPVPVLPYFENTLTSVFSALIALFYWGRVLKQTKDQNFFLKRNWEIFMQRGKKR